MLNAIKKFAILTMILCSFSAQAMISEQPASAYLMYDINYGDYHLCIYDRQGYHLEVELSYSCPKIWR